MAPLTIPNGRLGTKEKSVLPALGAALLAASVLVQGPLRADEAFSAAANSGLAAAKDPEANSGTLAPKRSATSVPCPARDPEDGKCYPSADAADLAWLTRNNPVARAHPAAPQPATPVVKAAPTTLEDRELPLEEDPDGEDSGAVLAALDSKRQATPQTPMAQELLEAQKSSIWRRMIRTVKGWAVRKSDGTPVSMPEKELEALFSAGFPLPFEKFSLAKFKDTFNSPRGRHKRHHAIDLPAPHGTPLVAVTDGIVERLGRDPRGGKVVYLRDSSGKFLFYYAHLAAHEPGLRAGDKVRKGQRVGFVGSTGRVIGGPHLHFAIFRVEGASSFQNGFAINPYVVFAPLIPR